MARPKKIEVPLSERENFIHGKGELMGILGISYDQLKKDYLDCGLRPWRTKGGKEYYRMRDLYAFMDNFACDSEGKVGKKARHDND